MKYPENTLNVLLCTLFESYQEPVNVFYLIDTLHKQVLSLKFFLLILSVFLGDIRVEASFAIDSKTIENKKEEIDFCLMFLLR